jgi:chromosome partitioning protein
VVAQNAGTGLDGIRELVSLSDAIIEQLMAQSYEPKKAKQLNIRYSITEVAEMVGRTPAGIRKAEANKQLPAPLRDAQNRRVGYSLEEVNHMRDIFGTRPRRQADEEPVVLSIQNFKGGVGKSTMTAHLSQYLARRGYRVLVIDCDSQASTTAAFGYRPDLDLTENDTLRPLFSHGGQKTLDYAIRPTYWPGLDLIGANLSLYTSEYDLAGMAGREGGVAWLNRLRNGIDTLKERYDIILMDPPPALGMISLNVLRAANALIIPTPAAMYDYHSTVTFLRMMDEVLSSIERLLGEEVNYKFLKLLISKLDDSKSAQTALANMMKGVYAKYICRAILKNSAEIDNAGADWKTVYELEDATTSRSVYKRCVTILDNVCKEIESLIRSTWPSHREALEQEGYM